MFRLLFGAGMMGGYTTYSSIAPGLAQTIFCQYTINYTHMMLAVAVLLVGGLVAAAAACRRVVCGVSLGARP